MGSKGYVSLGGSTMSDDDVDSDAPATPSRVPQYSARATTRHRTTGGARRLLFFSLASSWGFIAGAGGVLAAMDASGLRIADDEVLLTRLVPAFVFAAAGGLVTAAAYRESRRRSR
jgi:hypothetical protein